MDALVMGNQGVLPQGVDGLLGVKYMSFFGLVDFDFRTSMLSVFSYDVQDEVSVVMACMFISSAGVGLMPAPVTLWPTRR
jgi:hypothetical protein